MLDFVKPRTLTMSGPALPEGPGGESMLELKGISGDEALSEIYAYTLDCLTAPDLPPGVAANIDLKSMIGQELTVMIQLEGMGSFIPGLAGAAGATNIGAGTREISGIVAHARYVNQSNRQSRYELILKPWIWLADQRSDFRIFQRKTVIEIVEEVFDTYTYSYDLRLGDQYPMLDYQVQYGETDYRFVQRMLAEHGIYWFFEHSNTFHRMVLVDHLGSHKPVESEAYHKLWYYPPGHKIDMEYIDHFDLTGSLQSGRWTTNDFDFKNPGARLSAENELIQDTAHNDFERYEWPGDYTELERGEDVARLRMEEVRAHGERAQGSGALRNVVCGTTFELEGYPYEAANREYLVISAGLHANELAQASGGGDYHFQTSFVVQPATTIYRPQRDLYPKPRTSGPQTAIVTGAPGSEIWTDKYGRVKLKFHWDRSDVRDQNSSCWIRVSYPWAGGGFGGVNVPRVGTEVIVDFENGDPDRPIVVGRLYNAATMPPWDLPGNATQSGLLSRSMKGGAGNANAIRFEDKQGAEELWLQAEKDMRTEVEDSELHTVGNNRMKAVGQNEVATVGAQRSHSVKSDDIALIGADKVIQVLNNFVCAAGDSITLSCGDSIIELRSNGEINMTCTNFNITAAQSGKINSQGGTLDLNMGSKAANIAPHGAAEKAAIKSAVDKTFPSEK
ncbi:type VI secretion system tip protein VgrG [Paraburkholderia sp. LEh10]|uniref:type VI secretion system Vgr family protein n=1 Tax=Paraburkholderia sp. LEh10 TaxID=2821353 RepID=UPI001AE3E3A5|nr:type VI secretion system tip protein TssI/VgrG [Paraburkholderia sp. LEh10]MBP0593854.1 type VI secretion system tip protein VgrG [Paraburkholderia sp. LEh10]